MRKTDAAAGGSRPMRQGGCIQTARPSSKSKWQPIRLSGGHEEWPMGAHFLVPLRVTAAPTQIEHSHRKRTRVFFFAAGSSSQNLAIQALPVTRQGSQPTDWLAGAPV